MGPIPIPSIVSFILNFTSRDAERDGLIGLSCDLEFE